MSTKLIVAGAVIAVVTFVLALVLPFELGLLASALGGYLTWAVMRPQTEEDCNGR